MLLTSRKISSTIILLIIQFLTIPLAFSYQYFEDTSSGHLGGMGKVSIPIFEKLPSEVDVKELKDESNAVLSDKRCNV